MANDWIAAATMAMAKRKRRRRPSHTRYSESDRPFWIYISTQIIFYHLSLVCVCVWMCLRSASSITCTTQSSTWAHESCRDEALQVIRNSSRMLEVFSVGFLLRSSLSSSGRINQNGLCIFLLSSLSLFFSLLLGNSGAWQLFAFWLTKLRGKWGHLFHSSTDSKRR